jgi:hypothetical protein
LQVTHLQRLIFFSTSLRFSFLFRLPLRNNHIFSFLLSFVLMLLIHHKKHFHLITIENKQAQHRKIQRIGRGFECVSMVIKILKNKIQSHKITQNKPQNLKKTVYLPICFSFLYVYFGWFCQQFRCCFCLRCCCCLHDFVFLLCFPNKTETTYQKYLVACAVAGLCFEPAA